MIVAMAAPAFAQSNPAPNAPAGGIGSSTAPSNSQGTPSGGTGVIGTTTTPAAPMAAAPAAPTTTTTHHTTRRRAHHTTHHTTPAAGTTAQ